MRLENHSEDIGQQPSNTSVHNRPENVVEKLQRRIHEAKSMGYKIRLDLIDGQQAGWCELCGVKTIFLDASHRAGEQLLQLEEILKEIGTEMAAAPDATRAA